MKKLIITFFALLAFTYIHAQDDDLLKSLDDGQKTNEHEPISSTFKGTRLINYQTVETLGKKTLEYYISHRFADLSTGFYDNYGIDGPASIRMGLAYSYDGKLVIGAGRSNIDKLYDGYLKYRILRQTTDNHIPVSLTAMAEANYTIVKDAEVSATHKDKYTNPLNRFSFVYQIMIARAFGKNLSLQLAPTMVHYNLVEKLTDANDMYGLVFMGRYKLNGSLALTGEYAMRLNNYSRTNYSKYHNSMGIGVDIETGGHVFQIHLSNSIGINEAQSLPYTTGDVTKGQLKLGFNIARWF